jgi:hypothetical protein
MSASIAELQKQIAELQLGIAPKVPVAAVNDSSTDLKALIREAIREEMSLLKDSTPAAPVKELSMLEAVGLCLTVEEQQWLSRPEILAQVEKKLSLYMQTEGGKSAVRSFLTYFRGFYEN